MSFGTLARVALRRPRGFAHGAGIPSIEVARNVTIDPAWLAAYRTITGGVDDGVLPPCAPQVLGIDLHLQILLDARFPLPALGMVHVENIIEERRALPCTGDLVLSARVSGHRPHDKGVTFDITTEARPAGEDPAAPAPWQSVMRALVRDRQLAMPQPRNDGGAEPALTALSSSSIRVREDTGRRYARVAGDANPIHLWALTAKAFGFPRAIAHGMWTLARSLNEVSSALPGVPRTITAKFIRPVLLPSTVVVTAGRAGEGVHLTVAPERPGAPHLKATVTPAI